MSRPRSFLEELERFYLGAWRAAKEAGYYYERIAESVLEQAKAVGGLMPDYASRLFTESRLLLIDLMKEDYSFKRELKCLNAKLDIKFVSKMALDVLGILDVPSGRGVWLYAYSPECGRMLLMRVMARDARVLARKLLFKRVIVRALKGSLAFIPALNKAYRHSPRLRFETAGGVEWLPLLKPEQLLLARGGLVVPSLLVETPVPGGGGNLRPGLGVLAAVKGASLKRRASNLAELAAGNCALFLDSSYAPPCSAEEISVIIIFLRRRRGLDGFYLGSVSCEQAEGSFSHYLPSNLLISMRGLEVAKAIGQIPREMLKYYEPSGGYKEGYELFKQWLLRRARGRPTSEKEILQRFYELMGGAAFTVPNPSMIDYEEMPLWLREAALNLSLNK